MQVTVVSEIFGSLGSFTSAITLSLSGHDKLMVFEWGRDKKAGCLAILGWRTLAFPSCNMQSKHKALSKEVKKMVC